MDIDVKLNGIVEINPSTTNFSIAQIEIRFHLNGLWTFLFPWKFAKYLLSRSDEIIFSNRNALGNRAVFGRYPGRFPARIQVIRLRPILFMWKPLVQYCITSCKEVTTLTSLILATLPNTRNNSRVLVDPYILSS